MMAGPAASMTFNRRVQHVANAAHGMDQLRAEVIIHFAAQPPDSHINYVSVTLKINIPDQGGDEISWQHFTATLQQQLRSLSAHGWRATVAQSLARTGVRSPTCPLGSTDAPNRPTEVNDLAVS